MKAIAIVEIDEKLFDELSNENLSMRLLWGHDIMWTEKSKYFDHVILRPFPERKDVEKIRNLHSSEQAPYAIGCALGYNACLDEVAGETK